MQTPTTPTEPHLRHASQPTRRADRSAGHAEASDLEALSAATDRYTRTVAGQHRRRRPSVTLAALTSIVVGSVLTFAVRFEYRCAATLRITGDESPTRRALCRKELLDYAWAYDDRLTGAVVSPGRWFVDSPSEDRLRLSVITSDRPTGIEHVRRIAQGYCEKMRATAAAARATPTDAETVLTEYVTELEARLNEAQAQVDAAIAPLSETDPSEQRKTLVLRWQALRSDFAKTHEQLSRVLAEVAGLRSAPEPSHGLVPSDERRRAIEADDALQQDLRELTVNLSELKLHLHNVWQHSTEPQEQLLLAAEELLEVALSAPNPPTVTPGKGHRRGVAGEWAEQLVAAAEAYRKGTKAFLESWNRRFTAIQRLDVEPLSAAILHDFQHVRRIRDGFLSEAGLQLAGVRSQVQAVGEDPTDDARHHVFQSNLIRAFQSVQAAHHRFEFATSEIETSGNFRLDAALTSARGLRRRSQGRIQMIEERLQAKAAQRARKRRLQKRNKAEQLIEQLRATTDRTVDMLLALQEELNLSAEHAEIYSRVILKTEVALSRFEVIQTDLRKIQKRLHKLAEERLSAADAVDVEVVSSEVISGPVNLTQRLRVGGIGAALTLFTVLLGQWWITRRS